MTSSDSHPVAGHPIARTVAGLLGIAGSIAAGYSFVLVPMLTVPTPVNYAFYAAWLIPLALSIAWWRSHPWRALAVPVVAIALAYVAWQAGTAAFGWAP